MVAFACIAAVVAAAFVLALADAPKFEDMENRQRHQAVYYAILVLFVLISAAQILLRA
jgi:hypothetical protein